MLLTQIIGLLALLVNLSHQLSIRAVLKTPKKPIWMIAHKCLTVQSIDDAITNGANAFEMDLTAYKEGWWAQHPGETWHDSIGTLFEHLSEKAKDGENVQWVWLDIKNPDAFKDGLGSIQALQTLVREQLSNHGIAALYGFSVNSAATKYVAKNLRENEGINYDASSDVKSENKTPKDAIKVLQGVKRGHRIGSYGWNQLRNSFGTCYETEFYTCTELRQAVTSVNWNKVFGWTASNEAGEKDRVEKLFNIAKVDGMIFGHQSDIYSDDENTRAAAKMIKDWIAAHKNDAKLADDADGNPWFGPV
ncbi:MAG: hypothetical protein Q9219_004325 [cf. Caloplaca sp. 3 TL-2023]